MDEKRKGKEERRYDARMRNKAGATTLSERILPLTYSTPDCLLLLLPSQSVTVLWLLPPASEQLPLLSLEKMKADESIWPVALKCTCLCPSLGVGDNEPID